MRVLIVLAALPLAASAIARFWDLIWAEPPLGILPAWADRVLTATETAVGFCALLAPSSPTGVAVGCTYAMLAVGVVVLKRRYQGLPCGCWGRGMTSVLSWRLAAFDAVFAAGALAASVEMGPQNLDVTAMSIATGCALILLTFMGAVIAPTYRPLIREAVRRADRYREWAHGYPSLVPGQGMKGARA